MGRQMYIFLTAFLLFIKEYGVSAQYATVLECLPQATATIARPIVQSAGQYILPAIIQPIIPGYDSYAPEPCFPDYGNFPAPSPGYPPIIIRDDDDILRSLLYFLIFSMGNKKDSYCNAPYNGYCSGSGKCQCCCNCPNCSKNNAQDTSSETTSTTSTATTASTTSTAPIYIPVPIAIPVYTGPDGCRYIDGFCDDILIQEPCDSCCGRDDEINLIIRTN